MNIKRTIFAATTILALGVPMAAPAFADPPRSYRTDDRNDWRNDGRRDYDRREYDRRDHRPDKVVVVKKSKWKAGDRYDHRRNSYRPVDYRTQHLKAPPRGYHYVRDNNTNEIILAAIATGVIAAIIANN
jgi:Ni/Co efflux regulator RcnB